MTRFEQIKAMDIEEMAKQFNEDGCMTDKVCREQNKCPFMDEDGDISDDCDCTGCIKKWLEGEVEENET